MVTWGCLQDSFRIGLRQSSGQWHRTAVFFLDTENIQVGDLWANRIIEALKHSRLLLAVWTPSYFRSPWCQFEWETFEQRSKLLATPLTVPLLLADGEYLPEQAKAIQYRDVRSYARTGSAFKLTERYIKFEDEIQELATDIARMLDAVPAALSDWPMPDRPARF